MTRVRLKVTGLTRPDDASFAVEAGADVIGCVFYARSPRFVSPSTATSIRAAIGPATQLHGVFVDTPPALIQRVAEQCRLDRIQLFGSEPRGDVEQLGDRAYKALSVGTSAGLDSAIAEYVGRRGRRDAVPGLLVHLRDEIEEDWDACRPLSERVPLVIASGGIDAGTIREVADIRPWAIDVWDRVELEPGVLDRSGLRSLLEALRA